MEFPRNDGSILVSPWELDLPLIVLTGDDLAIAMSFFSQGSRQFFRAMDQSLLTPTGKDPSGEILAKTLILTTRVPCFSRKSVRK